METASSIEQLRTLLDPLRAAERRIGFVPTMGYLHEGHLSLVEVARRSCDAVVTSIYVNPSQFNDPRDLDNYPRDTARDLELLRAVNCDVVFLPETEEIYPAGFQSWVNPPAISAPWEGERRPGHFRGVSTVVLILFHIVEPHLAVFGEKDFQQVRVIEEMTRELKLPLQIVRAPIVRERDGLAMSSRNVRLSPGARLAAALLSAGLFEARAAFYHGCANGDELCAVVRRKIAEDPGIEIEYVAVCDEKTLHRAHAVSPHSRILLAAWIDGVRLIDNLSLKHIE